MPRYTYSDPGLAATAENLATILAGPDVTKEAQVAAYMANAGKNKAETAILGDQLGARQNFTPELVQGALAGTALPAALQGGMANLFANSVRIGEGNPQQIAEGLQSMLASLMAAQAGATEDNMRQAAAVGGQMPTKDTYYTSRRQDARIAGDNAADYRKATSVAGIGAAAQRYNADRDYDAAIYGHNVDANRPLAVDGSLMSPLGALLGTAPVRPKAMGVGANGRGVPELTAKEALDNKILLADRLNGMFPDAPLPAGAEAQILERMGIYQAITGNAEAAMGQAISDVLGTDAQAVDPSWLPFSTNVVAPSAGHVVPAMPQVPMPTYAQPAQAAPAAKAPAAPAAKPAAPAKPQAAASPEQLIAEANSAIERGADPVKVRERLKKLGVTLQE